MKILLIDDHPITISGYIQSLQNSNHFETSMVFSTAGNCFEFYQLFENSGNLFFDLVIIDQGLPSYEEKNISSGSDIALMIKKKYPDSKIIIITAHSEVLVVYDIYKKISPNGLITKNDLTPANLPLAVKEILVGGKFVSPSVKKIISEIWQKELMVDDVNRQILFYLAEGYKVKSLEDVIPLSISPIQRRISLMKEAFGVDEEFTLVQVAKKEGYI